MVVVMVVVVVVVVVVAAVVVAAVGVVKFRTMVAIMIMKTNMIMGVDIAGYHDTGQ